MLNVAAQCEDLKIIFDFESDLASDSYKCKFSKIFQFKIFQVNEVDLLGSSEANGNIHLHNK